MSREAKVEVIKELNRVMETLVDLTFSGELDELGLIGEPTDPELREAIAKAMKE